MSLLSFVSGRLNILYCPSVFEGPNSKLGRACSRKANEILEHLHYSPESIVHTIRKKEQNSQMWYSRKIRVCILCGRYPTLYCLCCIVCRRDLHVRHHQPRDTPETGGGARNTEQLLLGVVNYRTSLNFFNSCDAFAHLRNNALDLYVYRTLQLSTASRKYLIVII